MTSTLQGIILYAMKTRKWLLYLAIFIFINLILDNFLVLKEYNEKRFALHTITEIHVLARNKFKAKKAVAAAFDRIKEIETQLNYFDPQSQTAQLNSRAFWEEVPVSKDMFNILTAAIAGSEKTEGAFDITTTPITRLYGFGTTEKHDPANKQIAEKLKYIGYQNIKLDPEKQTVRFLKKGLLIDLGGILKGYAVDEAVKVLEANGIKNGLVNAGGNIYALGKNHGQYWKIGIKNPLDTKKTTNDVLKLSNNACATSGDYEQYFYQNKKKISHIFNPKTGQPSNLENKICSVTVIADNATEADILSTACFVLGQEKTAKLIKNKTIFYCY